MPDNEAQTQDERKFNDTLKRMLKTPPKPHVKENKQARPKRAKAAKRKD